ncbi:hypothetical protein K2X14_07865 [Acetobacter sp. TBRC 12305]|uniref:Uncharacterized protein n=1 Tax=Acetobacter garciniae TaxID=2817435 RepID=A0A939HPX9_9PROT|nr:hypothetical protein [Acetobacter garciniae]MBO1325279.1 hypothetical protein [Acetobacter garciniae]MBX0344749.1 hypothetical protein [Acetobacter garciniae]
MTDQKPTGVFVRLPLSNEQIGKLLAPIGTLNERLSPIGTPVTGGKLEVFGYADAVGLPLEDGGPTNWTADINAKPDETSTVPLVRHSDAQAAIAALQAENARLREALSHAREAITSDENKSSIVCTVWAGPGETLVDYISSALEGSAA